MNDFVNAIMNKIGDLSARRDELTEELASVDARLEVLYELVADETGEQSVVAKNKGGRPRGSKNKRVVEVAIPVAEPSKHAMVDDIAKEAATMPGTDPEIAERIRNRKKVFAPRVAEAHTSVKVSGKKGNPNEEVGSSSHRVGGEENE